MQRTLAFSTLTLALTSCFPATKHSCEDDNTCGASTSSTGGSAGASAGGGSGGQAGATGSGGEAGAVGSGGNGGASPTGGAGGTPTGGRAGSGATGGSATGGSASGGTTAEGGQGGHGAQGGHGGQGGQGGQGGAPPTCAGADPSASPARDRCVISEDHGVFVSPAGDDTSGLGTRDAPYATLAHAIAEAAARNLRVYACATSAPFGETLAFDSTHDDLELFGGFDCVTWEYSAARQARINGGITAVTVDGTQGLALTDFDIVSAGASVPGDNSVALFATDADVSLERVALTAGDGADGEDGALFPFAYPDVDTELAGCDATDDTGVCAGANGRCTAACPAGDSTMGGIRGPSELNGGNGAPLGDTNGGVVTTSCGNGGTGADGANGGDGSGATALGTLSSSGWLPAPGTNGAPGSVGQGGGGGSGGPSSGIGGGGGCGGCGGNGAARGAGGGASIALVSFQSTITLTDSTLVTGDAGHGGDAAQGQPGQSNPLDSSVAGVGGVQDGLGCKGGNGGIGGDGGAAGGGAGGISVGILYSGAAPSTDAATSSAITTGNPGDGGNAATGLADTAGIDGVNDPIHEAP